MKKLEKILIGTLLTLSTNLFSAHHEESESPLQNYVDEYAAKEIKEESIKQQNTVDEGLEAIAESWIKAYYSSKDASTSIVKEHLAENGISVGSRYVGFGFMFNQNEDPGRMIITSVVPDSPASLVLRVGDEFISVNGVRVNEANIGKLAFRGKPDQEVRAIIKRDGKTKNISVKRGVIAGSFSKEQILNNINQSNSEEWAPLESNIIEVVSRKNVVYVLHWHKRIDKISELPWEAYTVTRFTFNDERKIDRYGNLSEDRFVLEQQGYKISR